MGKETKTVSQGLNNGELNGSGTLKSETGEDILTGQKYVVKDIRRKQ